jgi:glutaredoxin
MKTEMQTQAEMKAETEMQTQTETKTKIIIYGKTGCINCDLAKSALSEFDIVWEYVDIDTINNSVITMIKKEKLKLPYIIVDNNVLGGYAQLCTFLNNYEINLNLKLDNF